jgi:hypothetical protein
VLLFGRKLVYGSPSDEAKKALKDFNPVYFTPFWLHPLDVSFLPPLEASSVQAVVARGQGRGRRY